MLSCQASAAAEDSFGSHLRLTSTMPGRGPLRGVLPRRGCCLQLQLDLSWPLTAFLPPVRLHLRTALCHASALAYLKLSYAQISYQAMEHTTGRVSIQLFQSSLGILSDFYCSTVIRLRQVCALGAGGDAGVQRGV